MGKRHCELMQQACSSQESWLAGWLVRRQAPCIAPVPTPTDHSMHPSSPMFALHTHKTLAQPSPALTSVCLPTSTPTTSRQAGRRVCAPHLCGQVYKHLLAALSAILPDLITSQVGVHRQPHILGLHSTAQHRRERVIG